MASTGGGLISVWPFASEGSESTPREADVLATLPMYDPGMLASCGIAGVMDLFAAVQVAGWWDDLGRRQICSSNEHFPPPVRFELHSSGS